MMAPFVGTSKEKFYYHNTLLCLVRSLQDKNITIDLRTDAYVCGCVASVDGNIDACSTGTICMLTKRLDFHESLYKVLFRYMNVSFVNAVYCDTHGNEYFFENLFVQARNIRYVHVPETISVITAINDELNHVKFRDPSKKPMQKSRKATKALQLHMQTVASLGKPDVS